MKRFPYVALALMLLSCGSKHDAATSDSQVAEIMTEAAPVASVDDVAQENSTSPVSSSDGPGSATPVVATAPRLLIYHADLRLKVESLAQTAPRLDSLVRRSGGYLSASTETRENGEWRQEMTIRVQPGRFSGLLGAIGALGTVENKKITTDDVTAEHADVAARLRTKRAVEQRYVALLAQAKKIKDVLDIEEKIGQVREEIESTESRLKTLNDEVAYSTITLTCYQVLAQSTPDAPVVSFGSRLLESVYDGWSMLTSLVIGAVAIWPLLLLGAAGWWAVRRWRRNRQLNK
ncbi:DUF4349 domain-containing protein [Hymenobacter sp. ASUV-10]|uniref:DUF4349 domain-containing protein n=1 Tax=Hymenobacter aranciens TaxID=3063996 RepID=A0ABT9BA77_9BACT|nr:DUF4349 domain-containing protein [Hymenobacter sp. ASUV-10]MDO7873942.1 DUF4349 domain-containing protein [Hymenobacter sp. ASUV-10]